METTKQLWSLWAYCPTTSKKTLVARGPESEMRTIFDRLVRRDDRLELIDAAGEKQSTTAGPLTDYAEPDDGAAPLGPNDRRLNAIEQTNTTIARRLDAIERKQSEDRKIREAYLADQARHLFDLEDLTAERLDALARRLEDHTTATNRDALSFAASVGEVHGNLSKRVAGLQQLAKANAENIKRNHDEALSFAASVGDTHRELKSCLADLRRDLETLAAQVDATAQTVATRAQPPATDADETPLDRLRLLEVEFADSLGEISRLRKQSLDTANAVAKLVAGLTTLGR